jgi:hypothetical protein
MDLLGVTGLLFYLLLHLFNIACTTFPEVLPEVVIFINIPGRTDIVSV